MKNRITIIEIVKREIGGKGIQQPQGSQGLFYLYRKELAATRATHGVEMEHIPYITANCSNRGCDDVDVDHIFSSQDM
jgi:hypothetical protein